MLVCADWRALSCSRRALFKRKRTLMRLLVTRALLGVEASKKKKERRTRASGGDKNVVFLNALRKATSTPVGYALSFSFSIYLSFSLCHVSVRNDRFNYRTCVLHIYARINFWARFNLFNFARSKHAFGFQSRRNSFVRLRDAHSIIYKVILSIYGGKMTKLTHPWKI